MDNIITDTFFWLFAGLFVVSSTVGALAYFTLFKDPLRSPLSEPDDERPIPPPTVPRLTFYNADNVRTGRVYPITISGKTAQTICVRQIFGGSFLIVVHTTDTDDGNGPYPSFNGWAVQIPTNRLIRPENLLPHQPS
jgi:hypothetical protein